MREALFAGLVKQLMHLIFNLVFNKSDAPLMVAVFKRVKRQYYNDNLMIRLIIIADTMQKNMKNYDWQHQGATTAQIV